MDATSKKVLDFLLDPETNPEGHMFYVDFYDSFCDLNGISEHRAMACLRYLEEQGFIKSGTNQKGTVVGFELEHKAYEKVSFDRKAVFSFLMKSIVTPIVVAVLTTFATLILLNLAKESLPLWLTRLLQ